MNVMYVNYLCLDNYMQLAYRLMKGKYFLLIIGTALLVVARV